MRDVPKNKIFFHNYYTALPLIKYLYNKIINSLDTTKFNSLLKRSSLQWIKQMKRGISIEYITFYESPPFSVVV